MGGVGCVYLGLEGRMVMVMSVEVVIQKQGDDDDHDSGDKYEER